MSGEEIHPLARLLQKPTDRWFGFTKPMELQRAKDEDLTWTMMNITDPLREDELLRPHFEFISNNQRLGRLTNTEESFKIYLNRFFHYMRGSPNQMTMLRANVDAVLKKMKESNELYTRTIVPKQTVFRSQAQAYEDLTKRPPRKSDFGYDFYERMEKRDQAIKLLFKNLTDFFQAFSIAAEPAIYLSWFIPHMGQNDARPVPIASPPQADEGSKISVYDWTYSAERKWERYCNSPSHSNLGKLVKIDEKVSKWDSRTGYYSLAWRNFGPSKDFKDTKKRDALIKDIGSEFLSFVDKEKWQKRADREMALLDTE